jgi:hypothetical protein
MLPGFSPARQSIYSGKKRLFATTKPRTESICRDEPRRPLDEAEKVDETRTELIYNKVENIIYSGISSNGLLYKEVQRYRYKLITISLK